MYARPRQRKEVAGPWDGGSLARRMGTRVQRALGESFTLGDRLGRGGFALVYEATDERLKRRVAVKILRTELAMD